MRSVPAELAAHIAGEATTLCHCWRLTRRDGVVYGFTEHDEALSFDDTAFQAATGFSASEAERATGLAASSDEVAGAFMADSITEKDLRDGRFDGARVEVFLVNWSAPDEFMHLSTHELGEVSSDGQAFRAELRGLVSRLDQVRGRVYGRRCDADLGDSRCGIDLSSAAYRGEGTVVSANGALSVSASGLGGFAKGWFRQGLVTWTSGVNDGLTVEVAEHTLDDHIATLEFWVPASNEPEPGDTFTVTAGCPKTLAACRDTFDNIANFRGFPHMPGSDFAYGYADADTVHDGRPLVE